VNPRAALADAAFYSAGALILGALAHFALVLSIPLVATHDAYNRLAEIGPKDSTLAVPRAGPHEGLLAYADPAVANALCFFDLTNGPIRVRAPLGRAAFASLSFHSQRGAVFYALTDRAATHGMMEALIATPKQLRAIVAQDDEDNPSEDLRIASPTLQGFVLARIFSELPSLYAEAEAQAKSLSCAPEPPAK
jgi:uncharacterized membrane protein